MATQNSAPRQTHTSLVARYLSAQEENNTTQGPSSLAWVVFAALVSSKIAPQQLASEQKAEKHQAQQNAQFN